MSGRILCVAIVMIGWSLIFFTGGLLKLLGVVLVGFFAGVGARTIGDDAE